MNAVAVLVSPSGLEHYLHQAIPLSMAMQVRVLEISDQHALLGAPLAPNINHLGTVFGGSASTLATLAAWSWLHGRLQTFRPDASLLLQTSSMQYLHPVRSFFRARAQMAAGASWDQFARTLLRRGRGRIAVSAQLLDAEGEARRFEGEFVALVPPTARPILRPGPPELPNAPQ
jgi:thioesterase domain-containing protein